MFNQSLRSRLAAIRGELEEIPSGPLIDNHVAIHFLVRGIRYHNAFALKLQKQQEESTDANRFRALVWRALNARAIMSNRIPDMGDGEENDFPYCFWHPQVPSEATLRQLLCRYPSTKSEVPGGPGMCGSRAYRSLSRTRPAPRRRNC